LEVSAEIEEVSQDESSLFSYSHSTSHPTLNEIEELIDEMDRLMSEYVDPRHINPSHLGKPADLHRQSLKALPRLKYKELWSTLLDHRRMIISTLSMGLAGFTLGLTAKAAIPFMELDLLQASTAAGVLGISGLGMWWILKGSSSEVQSRLKKLRDLRNSSFVSQDECFEFRKYISNKAEFRKLLGDLIDRLEEQRKISFNEHHELIHALNQGTWRLIDKILVFIYLRMRVEKILSCGSEVQPNTSEFLKSLLEEVSRSGDWKIFFTKRLFGKIKRCFYVDVIDEWIASLYATLSLTGHSTLLLQMEYLRHSIQKNDVKNFKKKLREFLHTVAALDHSSTLMLLEEREQLLQLLEKPLADPLKAISEQMSHWSLQHRWFRPLKQMYYSKQGVREAFGVEAIREKVDAFAKGYLCFLLEQISLAECTTEEGNQFYELFFNTWWNPLMFSCIAGSKKGLRDKVVQNLCFQVPKEPTPILVLLSNGGGGHISAGNSVKAILEAESQKAGCARDYQVEFANAPHGIFFEIDFIEKFCRFFGISNKDKTQPLNGEDFYNKLLQEGHMRLANLYTKLGMYYYSAHHERLEKIFEDYLIQRETEGHPTPKLIISNMPIINGIAAAVCSKRNIPFMVTATDLNTTSYINSLHFPENDFNLFKYAVAFPDFAIFSYFAKANFHPRQIEITGFPVRPEFAAARDRSPEGIEHARQMLRYPLFNTRHEKIEEGIDIPEGRKVIALSMGAQGSVLVYRYLDILVEMEEDFHVIVLCGNNKFRVEVERRYASSVNQGTGIKKVTITPLGHSIRVSDIMAASDLFIGKPGGNTTLETVYSGIPVLLDGTNGLMDNERGNAEFIEDYELGALIERIEDLPDLINRYLIKDEEVKRIRSTLRQQQLTVLQNRKFNHVFPPLIEEMLSSHSGARNFSAGIVEKSFI